MPFYQWNQEFLTVKVDAMDHEHQILIDKMNKLFDAYKGHKPRQEIETYLTDFVNYTLTHFHDEEAYMEKIAFAGLATHKIIHKQLLGQVTGYVEEFRRTGEFTEAFFDFLSVWLTSHIRGIDTKYSAKQSKVA